MYGFYTITEQLCIYDNLLIFLLKFIEILKVAAILILQGPSPLPTLIFYFGCIFLLAA